MSERIVEMLLQYLIGPLVVAAATWIVVRKTSQNTVRGMRQSAQTQEKVAEGDRLGKYADTVTARLEKVEQDLRDEMAARVVDRLRIHDLQNELRDERRLSHISIQYILAIGDGLKLSPECQAYLPPVPVELRRALDP